MITTARSPEEQNKTMLRITCAKNYLPRVLLALQFAQDLDTHLFESLKWMLATTGIRDCGFDFEDVGQPDKVCHVLLF